MTSPYLKSADAAKYLGITTERLGRLRFEKKGPPYRKITHNLTIYEISDLEEYLQKQKEKPWNEYPKIYPENE